MLCVLRLSSDFKVIVCRSGCGVCIGIARMRRKVLVVLIFLWILNVRVSQFSMSRIMVAQSLRAVPFRCP